MKQRKKQSCCSILQKVVRKCWSTFVKQTLMFCRETGLHGCKYICETQRSTIERVAWAITVLMSVCIAIGMLKVTYDYYYEHSILSVIESTHNGIWNYPFPAVTVCDLNRVSLKLAEKFVDNLTLPSTVSKEFIVQEMSLLNTLLYTEEYESQIRNNLSRLQIIFDMNNLSIPTVINSVTQSCQNLLESCKWKTQKKDCATLFRPSYTRDGICCSFNYITRDRIINEPNLRPQKMSSCGYQSGLIILLNLDPSDYHASIVQTVGTKIILHNPYEYPDYDSPSKLISMNKYSFLTVQPMETYSSNDIKWTSRRECIYKNEGDIINNDISKIDMISAKYSLKNCLTYCRATVIKRKFWYDTSWPGTNMSPQTLPLIELNTKYKPCNCKPDCNFYQYSVEHSAGHLNKRIYYNGLTYTNYPSKGKTWQNQTIIHIFFDDLVSIQYRRDMRYSWRHLFATSGGLLGVFAGFSFMSMFEIAYFFIIRVLTDTCIKRRSAGNVN
ncbi:Sodium channel protein Nach [Habropoda laboriosa]|uniref:Sodium channel protein Nach n=1 Tax=Habropoda laboriosa TaxID=597456 RepID=A0A0L7RFF3_9HYME|nr:Sodium channel protein Nach [Habropoda laboriosa]